MQGAAARADHHRISCRATLCRSDIPDISVTWDGRNSISTSRFMGARGPSACFLPSGTQADKDPSIRNGARHRGSRGACGSQAVNDFLRGGRHFRSHFVVQSQPPGHGASRRAAQCDAVVCRGGKQAVNDTDGCHVPYTSSTLECHPQSAMHHWFMCQQEETLLIKL